MGSYELFCPALYDFEIANCIVCTLISKINDDDDFLVTINLLTYYSRMTAPQHTSETTNSGSYHSRVYSYSITSRFTQVSNNTGSRLQSDKK